jgi:hypothetical protein
MSVSRAATTFVSELLVGAPVPATAKLVSSLTAPIGAPSGVTGQKGLVDAFRDYVLSSPLNLQSFLNVHRAKGSVVSGPSTTSGSNIKSTINDTVSLPFANRHVSLEELSYTTEQTSNGTEELRVDAVLVWLPIRTAWLPTKGVVTVTVYRKLSLVQGSSHPAFIVLSRAQIQQFRSAIASLSNTSQAPCMEDATLFTISVAASAGKRPTWTAQAGECPSDLSVLDGTHHYLLSNASCALDTLVAGLRFGGKADPTVQILNSCIPGYGG